jgi:hypothetical protein
MRTLNIFRSTPQSLEGNDRIIPQVTSTSRKFFPDYRTPLSPYLISLYAPSAVNTALFYNRRFKHTPLPSCYFTLEFHTCIYISLCYWYLLVFCHPFHHFPRAMPLTIQVVWCWHCQWPPPTLLAPFDRNRNAPNSYQAPHNPPICFTLVTQSKEMYY